jgi:hypothetical protein
MVASHRFRRGRHQGLFLRFAPPCAVSLELTGKNAPNERGFLLRQLQLIAHGEPSDVIELNTGFEPVLGQEEVLVSMEAAPLNPSDFTLVRGIYGVRPAFHEASARVHMDAAASRYHPAPNGLVGDREAALRQQVFDVSKA